MVNVSLRWKNHHGTLVAVLEKLLQGEKFVDVILAAEGKFIKVHRIVLCACSQYFEVYWSGGGLIEGILGLSLITWHLILVFFFINCRVSL